MKSEDGLIQVHKPLERDVLIGTEVRGHGHDIGTVRHRSINILRELSLTAVTASALDLHLKVVKHLGRNRERNVNHLAFGAYGGCVHVQRFSALRTHRRRIPAFHSGDIFALQPRAALVPLLTTGLTAGRFAQGLSVWNTYRVLGWRDAAICAGHYNGLRAAFKF